MVTERWNPLVMRQMLFTAHNLYTGGVAGEGYGFTLRLIQTKGVNPQTRQPQLANDATRQQRIEPR